MKTIKFNENNGKITVIMNEDDKKTNNVMIINDDKLNGKEIFELIDYRHGDTYRIDSEGASENDSFKMKELKLFFSSLIDKINKFSSK